MKIKTNKYWNSTSGYWVTEYTWWIFSVYKLTLFGMNPGWRLRRPNGNIYRGPSVDAGKVYITEKQAIEKFGNLKLLSNPYTIAPGKAA